MILYKKGVIKIPTIKIFIIRRRLIRPIHISKVIRMMWNLMYVYCIIFCINIELTENVL